MQETRVRSGRRNEEDAGGRRRMMEDEEEEENAQDEEDDDEEGEPRRKRTPLKRTQRRTRSCRRHSRCRPQRAVGGVRHHELG